MRLLTGELSSQVRWRAGEGACTGNGSRSIMGIFRCWKACEEANSAHVLMQVGWDKYQLGQA